jgi:hypothetical protein
MGERAHERARCKALASLAEAFKGHAALDGWKVLDTSIVSI